jgi:CRISPR-associated protein Csd2
MSIINDASKRHDFVMLFEVTDGNPNGDPDAGNLPRVDPETMQGLVTDVCIKRKVRNFIAMTCADKKGFRIYVNDSGIALNTLNAEAYTELGIKSTGTKQKKNEVDDARTKMCADFFDVRMFGAVMTTGINCGQVRGPLQLTFARSFDQVVPTDVTITRVAITKPEDAGVVQSDNGDDPSKSKTTEMGRKALIHYGLYMAHGFYSAPFAVKTGATNDDLEAFWQALQMMWDHDHSASRGLMSCRGLYIFTHDNAFGNAPAHTLFDKINAKLKSDVSVPRKFSDYQVTIDDTNMPAGISLTKLIG